RFPGPLRKLLGVWAEETDALDDGETRLTPYLEDVEMPKRKRGVNAIIAEEKNGLGLRGPYEARNVCDLIHAEGATVLARYGEEFYADEPALTVNRFGKGSAYYIASRNEEKFLVDFYDALIGDVGALRAIEADLPEGVTAQLRTDGEREFVFLMNFSTEPKRIEFGSEKKLQNLVSGKVYKGAVELPSYGSGIFEKRG
ncbi:beta-galactosidase trimerization domain-containing protein, partial [bacterium]|nr:beta-galactosidase trimerization domain-containing protein [bacterium]